MPSCEPFYEDWERNPFAPQYLHDIWDTVPSIIVKTPLPVVESKEISNVLIPSSPRSNKILTRTRSNSGSSSESPRRRGSRGGARHSVEKPSYYHGYCRSWNILGRYGYLDGIICYSCDILNAEFVKVGQRVLYQLQRLPDHSFKCINVSVEV